MHNHPLFFGPLDDRGSLHHLLEGLRQGLIATWDPTKEPHRLILNVPDDENRDHLLTHAEEAKSCLIDGIAAVASLAARVDFYSAPEQENRRDIRRALLLITELTRALPLLDRIEEIAEGGVPVTAAGPAEGGGGG